jgi:hypothetical protein
MLKALRTLDRRLVPLLGLVLTLVFALPAFETHACTVEPSAPAATGAITAAGDSASQCQDCGPACANGCCHAAHPAIAPDAPVAKTIRPTHDAEPWIDAAQAPLIQPSGPDRPPRI